MSTGHLRSSAYLLCGLLLLILAACSPGTSEEKAEEKAIANRPSSPEGVGEVSLGSSSAALSLLPIVRQSLQAAPNLKGPAGEPSAHKIAAHLASLGFYATDIARLQGKGVNPVTASARHLSGDLRIDDAVVLSDITVLAKATGLDVSSDVGDGYFSTVAFSVEKVWRGPKSLRRIHVRQRSGRQQDGTDLAVTSDFVPEVGDEYVLVGSSELYRHRTGIRPLLAAGDVQRVSLIIPPLLLKGDHVISMSRTGAPAPESVQQMVVEIEDAVASTLRAP